MRPARTDHAWSTFVAVAPFLLMAAIWAFIPPAVIHNAWIAERAEVCAIAGESESDVYGRTLDDMEKSLASGFRGFIIDAQSAGLGPIGSSDFSAWELCASSCANTVIR